MREIDEMDMPGFLKLRAWDARREYGRVHIVVARNACIDGIGPASGTRFVLAALAILQYTDTVKHVSISGYSETPMAGLIRNKGKQLIKRLGADYGFRTVITAFGSLVSTAAFAIYNGFLGIYHASLWYGTICVYYILLVILRGTIIAAEKAIYTGKLKEDARNRVCIIASCLLLILNMSLVIPISIMVMQQRPVSLTLTPAIAMATYTTYKMIMASVNLKRSRQSTDSLIKLLRTISFIDALVSILTLQNTLIMVNTNGNGTEMLPVTASTSAAILLAILLLSVFVLVDGIAGIMGRK